MFSIPVPKADCMSVHTLYTGVHSVFFLANIKGLENVILRQAEQIQWGTGEGDEIEQRGRAKYVIFLK